MDSDKLKDMNPVIQDASEDNVLRTDRNTSTVITDNLIVKVMETHLKFTCPKGYSFPWFQW